MLSKIGINVNNIKLQSLTNLLCIFSLIRIQA